MADHLTRTKQSTSSSAWVPFSELVQLRREPAPEALFFVTSRQRGGRWIALHTPYDSQVRGFFVFSQSRNGNLVVEDSQSTYHPRYLMAVLSSPLSSPSTKLFDWPIPAIQFSTDADVRRSMTLNGMRMSLEYFQSGSLRVLELVENRLQLAQRDIVHNILVFLMERVLDARARAQEARNLRAEAVAAYLGLQPERVQELFAASRLSTRQIAADLESGRAGTVRRQIDIGALCAGQLALLRPELRQSADEENSVLILIDEVVARLRQSVSQT